MTTKKTVLITGCTPGGIGHALCREFHAKGLHVIATARDPAVLTDLGKQGMTCLQLDVTKQASIDACLERVSNLSGGTLDILVNNAGRSLAIPASDVDINQARDLFETNVIGVIATTKAFIPLLVASRGLIINISSTSSIAPYPFGTVYSASKGAITSYSRSLRVELQPFGVRVMVTHTGTVRTTITNKVANSVLPEGSLYKLIEDVYKWRLGFSKTSKRAVDAEVYAERLVKDALKPEWPIWLREWVGRPDTHSFGGLARETYWGTMLGEWALNMVSYRMFKLNVLAERLQKAKAA